MKILIISYFFPPYNRIGALRVGKMAKYFHHLGHDVKVLTNHHASGDRSAPLEIPEENCFYTKATAFDEIIDESYFQQSGVQKTGTRLSHALRHKKFSYLLPDSGWAWYKDAVLLGEELGESWKPDLIYSSALPISSHFIARRIGKTFNIPWVAEYRDLWSGGHGARVTLFQSFYLKKIEKWLLKPAKGLISVSEPLAGYLSELHQKETKVIYNGFDTNPYAYTAYHKEQKKDGIVSIVYTGSIYEGRDPAVLFEALNKLGDSNNKVQVKFYTSKNSQLQRTIKQYNLEHCVSLKDLVPYDESLRVQSEADILLYLSYSSTTHKGQGILSGKVFEYLGADRPILSVGFDSGHLFVEQGLMKHSSDAEELKNLLINWIEEKEKTGAIQQPINRSAKDVYSRKEQAAKAEQFIISLVTAS